MSRLPRSRPPWHARALLLSPERVAERLSRVAGLGLVPHTPNLWQIELGILRMWQRILFRPETVGTCAAQPVRRSLRARLLAARPLRFPFLLWERAITPWDLSGLLASPDQIVRHLLCAHHDGDQIVYDLQFLLLHPGGLEALRDRVGEVVAGAGPRARWLRDLTVFEGYHEHLREGVLRFLAGDVEGGPAVAGDPDITFLAYLRWCADQPPTPAQTLARWRQGLFRLPAGLSPPADPSRGTAR